MKKKTDNQKGITLIILLVTIVVIGILIGVTVSNFDTGADIRNYNYMCADIQLLKDKIQIYYNNTGTIPTTGSSIAAKSVLENQAGNKDNNNYYLIDLTKLSNITLNFGGGNLEDNDVYIINEQSHEVYYLKGVVYEDLTFYRKGIERFEQAT